MFPRLALILPFVVVAAGCRCTPPTTPVNTIPSCNGVVNLEPGNEKICDTNAECGLHYACTPIPANNARCCVFRDRGCAGETDCCPGQTCPSDRRKCFDKFASCETDADCGDKGDRVCQTYTDNYGSSKRCRFKACGDGGTCPSSQSCFQGQCLADLPCQGTCEQGKGCVPESDRCQDFSKPKEAAAACPMSCGAGFIATFKDPTNLWDSCVLPKVACVCAELPSLRSEDLGRFSAMAAESSKGLLVSEYDGQYGDLVVVRTDLVGNKVGLDYIDGVPSSLPKYGPSGARGGVVAPGDDVGRYTDIAVSSTATVYVSYYDVTHGDLKVAVRSAAGKWTSHKVDGNTADVGLYTSIAIDPDGLPGISYYQRGADDSFDLADCPGPAPAGPKAFITALKYAHAKVVAPLTTADWSIQTLACQRRPAPPCYSCAAGETCADPSTGPGCFMPSSSCLGCDPNTEACVMVGVAAKCAKKVTPSTLTDITDGVGLFSSMTFSGKEALIVFMKRSTPAPVGTTRPVPDGDLYGIQLSPTGVASPMVKLDDVGDTGYFPEVKIDPNTNNVSIAYLDFTNKKLKFYFTPGFQSGVTAETIDTGFGPPASGETNWVGADSSLIFLGSAIYAVYQDTTKGDLKLAKRSGGAWSMQGTVRSEGAVGFYSDGALLDGKMYVSHARLHARLVTSEAHVDNSLIIESVIP